MKDSVREANEILPKIEKRKKQSCWMTDDILNLKDEKKLPKQRTMIDTSH